MDFDITTNTKCHVDFKNVEKNDLFKNFYSKKFRWYSSSYDIDDFKDPRNPFIFWYHTRADLIRPLIEEGILKPGETFDDNRIFDNIILYSGSDTKYMYMNTVHEHYNPLTIKKIIDANMNSSDIAIQYIRDFKGSYTYSDSIVEIKPATTQIFEIPRYLYNKYTDEELAKVPKELHFDYKPIKADNIILANFDTYDIHNCLPSIFFVKRTKVLTIKDVGDFQFTYDLIRKEPIEPNNILKMYDTFETKYFDCRFLTNNIFANTYIGIVRVNIYIAYEFDNIDEIIKRIELIEMPYGSVILQYVQINQSYTIIYSNLNKVIENKYMNKNKRIN